VINPPGDPAWPADSESLHEQARRYIECDPWRRWEGVPLLLDLKIGKARREACAQLFGGHGEQRGLMLFLGRRSMGQLGGLAEPPAGTIIMLTHPRPPSGFATEILTHSSHGWAHPERLHVRVLTVALAGLLAHDAHGVASQEETHGELTFPDGQRGRYRVRRALPEPGSEGVVIGLQPQFDLLPEGTTLTFTHVEWPVFTSLRDRALVVHRAKKSFRHGGDLPLVVIEAGPADGARIVERLAEADLVSVVTAGTGEFMLVMAAGTKGAFALHETEAHDQRFRLWSSLVHDADGAHALVVASSSPPTGSEPRWEPETVYGLFECRVGRGTR